MLHCQIYRLAKISDFCIFFSIFSPFSVQCVFSFKVTRGSPILPHVTSPSFPSRAQHKERFLSSTERIFSPSSSCFRPASVRSSFNLSAKSDTRKTPVHTGYSSHYSFPENEEPSLSLNQRQHRLLWLTSFCLVHLIVDSLISFVLLCI